MRTLLFTAIVLLAAPLYAQFPTAETVINQAYYSAPYYAAPYYRPYCGPRRYHSSWYYATDPVYAAYQAQMDYQTDMRQLRSQLNRIEYQQEQIQWKLNR